MDEQTKNVSPPLPIPGKDNLEQMEMNLNLSTPMNENSPFLDEHLLNQAEEQEATHYTFSYEAWLLLQERASISADEVVAMLNQGAFVKLGRRVHRERLHARHPWAAGMSLGDVRRELDTLLPFVFDHLMIWSGPDARPLTIIVKTGALRVVTVLYSENQPNGHDWSDMVTPERIAAAKAAYDNFKLPPELRGNVYARATWMDPELGPRGKQITGSVIPKCAFPLDDAFLDDLVSKSLALLPNGGHDLRIQLISKKGKDKCTSLFAEYEVTRKPGGEVDVQLTHLSLPHEKVVMQ